ncbi:MAG TPA: class I SAM-dependent methyltransferase [Rhodopila sp.]
MNQVQIAKNIAQSLIPFKHQIRRAKRSVFPYADNRENSNYCFEQGLEQIEALRSAGVDLTGDVLEFGSGWMPIIPLLFHLSGARSITLTDIERLMDDHTIAMAKAVIEERIAEVAAVIGKPADELLRQLREYAGFIYLAPWDLQSHPTGSVDLIISRAVFEHVPVSNLRVFLSEFHRILRTGGSMCHIVDNSDHWQHTDRSLSRMNFLRYSDGLYWKIVNMGVQNRLRHSDYEKMFSEFGFSVTVSDGQPDQKCMQDLLTLPLADRFKDYAHTDLAILTSLFVVSRKHDTSPVRASLAA